MPPKMALLYMGISRGGGGGGVTGSGHPLWKITSDSICFVRNAGISLDPIASRGRGPYGPLEKTLKTKKKKKKKNKKKNVVTAMDSTNCVLVLGLFRICHNILWLYMT